MEPNGARRLFWQDLLAMIWWTLRAVAALLLILHWRGPNAVWGSATYGALIGLVITIFRGFSWATVVDAASIAILIGAVVEWLTRYPKMRP